MESNSLQGGMYPPTGSGMLGLEMSLHHQTRPQPQPPHPNPTNHPTFLSQNPNPQTSPNYPPQDPSPHTHSLKVPNYPFPQKSKPQQLTISDEDETDSHNADGKRKITASSPWQRMKWTDSMVRLLIVVVYYIGDEAGSEGPEQTTKKKGGGGNLGILQKKGKWKSVSNSMLERGFYVSPQQCEDKFNDLNKRYKRVNDILGKGTACRVVENQNLLDTMDHLTPKKKEEVKKLLNSKHLFFREMCAYHTSCGSSSGVHSPETVAPHQQRCLHSSENGVIGACLDRKDTEEPKMIEKLEDDDDVDEEEDNDEDDDIDEYGQVDEDNNNNKRARKEGLFGNFTNSPSIQQLSGEVASVVDDVARSTYEKKQWVRTRMMQLEEKRVGFQLEAFELEKQRLKWFKFSSKKEREMEREKIQNERMRLENDRMLLILRQKEFEILDFQKIHHHKQTSNF